MPVKKLQIQLENCRNRGIINNPIHDIMDNPIHDIMDNPVLFPPMAISSWS
jgi:hypothetical protein